MNWRTFWWTFVVVGVLSTVGWAAEYTVDDGADVIAFVIDGFFRFAVNGAIVGFLVGGLVGWRARRSARSSSTVEEPAVLIGPPTSPPTAPPRAPVTTQDGPREAASPDSIEGPDPTRRGLLDDRRVRLALGVLAAVVLGLLVDWRLRASEMDRLLSQAEESEAVLNDYHVALDELAADLLREFGDPTYWTQVQRDQVRLRSQELAADWAPSVIDETEDVHGMFVVPWHRSISRARDSYTDHGEAWATYLRAVAGDGDELSSAAWDIDINATWEIAEDHFHSAIPPADLSDLEDRVDRMFAE